jgi:uncharacterized protein
MSLQTQIREDMVAAMKTRDRDTVDLLRVVAGEFGREMKDVTKELSDEEALKVIRKMSENAKELGNQAEVDILDKYLPQMFSESHIVLIVNEIIQQNGYSGMQDMGKVMSQLKSPLIDGKIASRVTRELLTK